MQSKCCNDEMYVEGSSEGSYYYVCKNCSRPTDPVKNKLIYKYNKDEKNR